MVSCCMVMVENVTVSGYVLCQDIIPDYALQCLKKVISLNYYMVNMCLFPLRLHPKGGVKSGIIEMLAWCSLF